MLSGWYVLCAAVALVPEELCVCIEGGWDTRDAHMMCAGKQCAHLSALVVVKGVWGVCRLRKVYRDNGFVDGASEEGAREEFMTKVAAFVPGYAVELVKSVFKNDGFEGWDFAAFKDGRFVALFRKICVGLGLLGINVPAPQQRGARVCKGGCRVLCWGGGAVYVACV